ncbi:MAG: serine O-acetyltransferase [Rhodocyclaceae bacterium]|nr:serine O-acetyltransferase [Rhodocyclaceae bacterium]
MVDTAAPGLRTLLLEDIDSVLARDPAARGRFEVLTTYPGVHAVIWHRLGNVLWRHRLTYLARLIQFLTRMLTQIDIHPAATIGRRLFIDHGTGVVIGETAVLGDDCTLYHGVTLGGTSWRKGKRHPTLGNGVVIGAGAKVLGPICVGNGVRIGANSVVVTPVPANRTVVGIPGRVVRSEGGRTPDGLDLDHHLVPDPVGKALACLLDRVRLLESRIEQAGLGEPDDTACEGGCSCGSVLKHPGEHVVGVHGQAGHWGR